MRVLVSKRLLNLTVTSSRYKLQTVKVKVVKYYTLWYMRSLRRPKLVKEKQGCGQMGEEASLVGKTSPSGKFSILSGILTGYHKGVDLRR